MIPYKRYVLSLVLSQLLTMVGWAQPTSMAIPDSLLRYLKTARQDTTYVRAANQYAWWLINPLDDLNRVDSLLKRTEALAKRLNDPMGLQRTYFNQGRAYMRRANVLLPKALACMKKAHQLVLRAHLPVSELQRALSGLGQAYFYGDQFETSLQYSLEAIKLTERYKLRDYATRAYIGAGEVMQIMGRPQETEKYYRKALAIAYEDQDKTMILWAEERMARVYIQQNNNEQALVHLQRALSNAGQYANNTLRVSCLIFISSCYMNLCQLDQALHYLKIGEKYARNAGAGAKVSINMGLGSYYYRTEQDQLAESHFKKAMQIAKEDKQTVSEQNAANRLAELYAQTGQYQKAYQHQLVSNALGDSLFSNQTAIKIRDMETRNEIEKREAQIKLLNQQEQNARLQRNTWIVSALLLLLLGVSVSAWLLNRSRLRRLQEAYTLRQQIAHDLHDEVGSTLSSISMLSGHTDTLLRQKLPGVDTSESAQKMVQKIYGDARQILESIDEIIWTINPGNDTLHRIALRLQEYATPLMESKNINFEFAVDAALDHFPVSMEVRRNLYLIGKEAINNLVKYSQATKSTLRFEQQNGQLKVLIEDDGQGFDVAKPTTRTGQSSMQQRATDMGGTLAIRSAPGQGTRLQLVVGL